MKPVDQLVRHDPEKGQRGDCTRACLASILEINGLTMPNFVEFHGPLGWWDEIRRWCRDNIGVDVAATPDLAKVQWGHERYAYAVASVQSPRGPWWHCVVVDRHGVIAHDPWPDPDGKLAGPADIVDDYWVFVEPYEWPTQPVDLPKCLGDVVAEADAALARQAFAEGEKP